MKNLLKLDFWIFEKFYYFDIEKRGTNPIKIKHIPVALKIRKVNFATVQHLTSKQPQTADRKLNQINDVTLDEL